VLYRMCEHKLYLRLEKCEFEQSTLVLSSHITRWRWTQ
jgi:hypothetical protein